LLLSLSNEKFIINLFNFLFNKSTFLQDIYLSIIFLIISSISIFENIISPFSGEKYISSESIGV